MVKPLNSLLAISLAFSPSRCDINASAPPIIIDAAAPPILAAEPPVFHILEVFLIALLPLLTVGAVSPIAEVVSLAALLPILPTVEPTPLNPLIIVLVICLGTPINVLTADKGFAAAIMLTPAAKGFIKFNFPQSSPKKLVTVFNNWPNKLTILIADGYNIDFVLSRNDSFISLKLGPSILAIFKTFPFKSFFSVSLSFKAFISEDVMSDIFLVLPLNIVTVYCPFEFN